MGRNQFEGLADSRVAVLCSADVDVGWMTVYKVLFKGHPHDNPATRRVRAWAARHNFPIAGEGVPQKVTRDDVEAALARVEQAMAAKG